MTVRDPQTGVTKQLTVIGVLKDTASFAMAGILTSQDALSAFGDRVQPAISYLEVAPGVNPTAAAKQLESAFLDHGVQADSIEKLLGDVMDQSRTFQRLVLGFLGLGLVVGVAALGVISAVRSSSVGNTSACSERSGSDGEWCRRASSSRHHFSRSRRLRWAAPSGSPSPST